MRVAHPEPESQALKPMQFIGEYQIPEPSICDGLVECFEECRTHGVVRRGTLGPRTVNLALKNSYDLGLGNIPADVGEKYRDVLDGYFEILGGFMEDYMGRFPHLRTHMRPCHINEAPNIQCYPANGGFFEEHFENGGPDVALRVLTFQSYLNDIEEGGGTKFVYQDFVCQPCKGKTILWPAGFTHVHCGVVAPREEKYIITGWWSLDNPP
jgi:hypothetical protein